MHQLETTYRCPRCLLRDSVEADKIMLKEYLGKIKESDRATSDCYESRLSICSACDKLNDATCEACGCYVEFRAYVKASHCPKKKW